MARPVDVLPSQPIEDPAQNWKALTIGRQGAVANPPATLSRRFAMGDDNRRCWPERHHA
jgi:hypothetical protein